MNSKRYTVKDERDSFGRVVRHFVWDNDTACSIKTVTTRKECRRLVVGLNQGWIHLDEVEEAVKV
jgi:hypothetical protein